MVQTLHENFFSTGGKIVPYGLAAAPAAGLAFDRQGRDEEVRQRVGVVSHRR
jgi:hypothetical protein